MNDKDNNGNGADGLDALGGIKAKRKQRLIHFFVHLLCISIMFVLPEVLLSMARPRYVDPNFAFWLKALVYIVVFYINYYYVIDSSFGRQRGVVRFLVINVVIVISMLILLYFIADRYGPPHKPMSLHGYRFELIKASSFVLRDFVMMVLTISLSVALKLSDRWLKLERRQHELAISRRNEELQNLKSQINPHFLFNTLNSIYALIDISSESAKRAVHELSKLLRYVLYENPETVTVRQELDFVDNYVRLMRLRLSDRMPLSVTLDCGNCGDALIAPLLFVNLIENAFKYGNTGLPDKGIEISIVANDNVVRCKTSNYHADSFGVKKGSGIGIVNLRRRLFLLYGDDATIHIVDDERFEVEMVVNLDALKLH